MGISYNFGPRWLQGRIERVATSRLDQIINMVVVTASSGVFDDSLNRCYAIALTKLHGIYSTIASSCLRSLSSSRLG